MKKMFTELIKLNQEQLKTLELKQREYVWYDDMRKLNKIISFVGPRRVGKTYLMLDFVKRLVEQKKIIREQVVFIDFSRYANQSIDPFQLLDNYFKLYPDLQPFFVFDEVQDIANMRQLILTLFNYQYKIFISGSNSKLLSSELSTHFRGRVFEYKVYPLTHKELLSFKNIPLKKFYATTQLASIKHLYFEVFTFGSFPEVVMTGNGFVKRELINEYYEFLLYRDLLERYHLENEYAMNYFLKHIALGFTKQMSIHKIYNDLKSLNIKLGKNSLYNYYDYIKSAFYVCETENFHEILAGYKKLYLYNLGFHFLFSPSPDFGQSFENVLFLELKKRFNRVFFKK